jgi:hypothetical protein
LSSVKSSIASVLECPDCGFNNIEAKLFDVEAISYVSAWRYKTARGGSVRFKE